MKKLFNYIFPRHATDRFRFILTITIINLFAFLVLAIKSFNSMTLAETRSRELHGLQMGIFELSALAQDYLESHSRRALRQWQSRYAVVHSSIINLTSAPDDQMELLFQVGRNLSELHRLFVEYSKGQSNWITNERREQLASYSRYLAHETSAKILQLNHIASQDLRRDLFIIWSGLIAFMVLSKILVSGLSYFMWRQSEKSMKLFKQSLREIEEGRIPDYEAQPDEDLNNLLSEVSRLGEVIYAKQKDNVDEIRTQREVAEKASAAKSTFLANISHEIRTPLSIIDGCTRMLISNDNDGRMDYLVKIHWNVKYIIRLVDELLDLSKIEAQKMEMNISQFLTTDLLPLLESMKQKASGKNINFLVQCTNPIPLKIKGDQTKIEQLLINIIGNGIKYTKKGYVKLSIGFSKPWLVFEVEDTGIGLTPEQVNQIFSPFYQANPTGSDGTGLGLALSSKIAEFLGGNVFLKRTRLGEGSVFVFEIPLQELDLSEMISTSTFAMRLGHNEDLQVADLNEKNIHPLKDLKILIVEDNLDLRIIIEALLKKYSEFLSFAVNGKEAVDLVSSPQNSFDLILMDIQMPIMDGYEACRAIRELKVDIPIIALTARVVKEEKNRGISAGFNAYLEKPFNIKKLCNILGSLQIQSREIELNQ